MIAIKAQYQNEIRRFALPFKSTFATLETSIINLFSLTGPVIKFTDDEGDQCTISTQQEFDTAVELNQGKVLRLHLFAPVVDVPQIPMTTSVPTTMMAPQMNKDHKGFWLEKMENKKAGLIARRDHINSKLADESLPAERRQMLTSKLEKIQEKITFFETKQQQISQHPHEHWKGGKGFGRGGQRGNREAAEHPEPEQQDRKKFWLEKMENKKAGLIAKRDEINSKLADESLPVERRRSLTSKLERIQEKIAFFETKQQQISQYHQGGRGQGSCARGRPDNHQQKPCWSEWMEKRQVVLVVKKESITAKLASAEITPERRNALSGKLLKVEEKIKAIEARKEMLNNQQPGENCRRGGRGQGRGHPGCGGGRGGKHFEVDQTPK
jgi:hypothetical protein